MGRSGYFSLNLSANSVMRGRLDARRTLKSLVADLRIIIKTLILYAVYCLLLLPRFMLIKRSRLLMFSFL
ncbi:hypothetical protein DWZ35_24980 [Bacteroides caccae]|nr:hypothetical protein DWZ35_24980 [Bacteroides caccae]